MGEDYVCSDEMGYGAGEFGSYFDYYFGYDRVGKKGEWQVESSFGCIYREHHFPSGIMGMSSRPHNQIWDLLYKKDKREGKHAQKLFTICTKGSDVVLNVGGIDRKHHIGEGVTVKVDMF